MTPRGHALSLPSLTRLVTATTALAMALVVTGDRPAAACMPAPPENHWVKIAEEVALVTYDPATHTEHFLRRASFTSDVADFGFLVPVPAKPVLTEGDPSVLARVEEATRPKLVYSHHLSGIDPTPLVLATFLMRSQSGAMPAPVSVKVLDEVTVAGFDAAVLEANSPDALADWLTKHGYAKGPELAPWLAPYIEKKWLITAFRISTKAPTSASGRIGSGLVDIAFQTDAPFYPYREPASMRGPEARDPRSLAVFYVGPERVKGVLGPGATWAGVPLFAKKLDEDLAGVPGGTKGRVLSAFVDRSSPRPGTDELFFLRADTQDDLVPPPIEISIGDKVPVPIDVVLVLGGALLLVGRAIRKRREKR